MDADLVVELPVVGHIVDFRPSEELSAKCSARDLTRKWFTEMRKHTGSPDSSKVSLMHLFEGILHIDSLRKVVGQVLLKVAWRIQTVFGKICNGQLNPLKFKMKWLGLKDRLSGNGLVRELALYVCNGKEHFARRGPLVYSMPTDKGN
jgi:hypothetical protein